MSPDSINHPLAEHQLRVPGASLSYVPEFRTMHLELTRIEHFRVILELRQAIIDGLKAYNCKALFIDMQFCEKAPFSAFLRYAEAAQEHASEFGLKYIALIPPTGELISELLHQIIATLKDEYYVKLFTRPEEAKRWLNEISN